MQPSVWLIAAMIAGMTTGPAYAKHPKPRPVQEFETCQINVEQNATDRDTEIVILAIGGDDGFRWFAVRSPDGRRVVQTFSLDRSVMGQRELLFESPEPPGDAILAGYPEGTYVCKGHTHRGDRFRSTAELSHQMPPQAVILSPAHESTVPVAPLLIQWSEVPGAQQVQLELENESADPEQSLTFSLSPHTTSFEIPAQLLVPESSYQLSIGTVAENGNKVFVEIEFETE
jgi:hypothetical protein